MSRSARSDLIDIELHLHHETEKAVLVSSDGDRAGAVWLPRSLVEIEPVSPGVVTVTLSERLAVERGLV